MLFKPFDDDLKCRTCGKKYNDLMSGKESCQPCDEVAFEEARAAPTHTHFIAAVQLFLNFQFGSCIGAILVGFESLYNKVKKWIRK